MKLSVYDSEISPKTAFPRHREPHCSGAPSVVRNGKSGMKLSVYDSEISPKTVFLQHKEPHCSGRDNSFTLEDIKNWFSHDGYV
jgi:hypothetical protein